MIMHTVIMEMNIITDLDSGWKFHSPHVLTLTEYRTIIFDLNMEIMTKI